MGTIMDLERERAQGGFRMHQLHCQMTVKVSKLKELQDLLKHQLFSVPTSKLCWEQSNQMQGIQKTIKQLGIHFGSFWVQAHHENAGPNRPELHSLHKDTCSVWEATVGG